MGDEVDNYDFSGTDAGASLTIPMEAGQIRKGGHIVIKGKPCKVVNVSTSKTGKHGHAKCNFTAIDIFTGKKYEDIVPSTHNTSVPNVTRTEFTLINIEEDFMTLMDEEGTCREDLKLPPNPEGFAEEIKGLFEKGDKEYKVTVLAAMGIEQVVAIKEDN